MNLNDVPANPTTLSTLTRFAQRIRDFLAFFTRKGTFSESVTVGSDTNTVVLSGTGIVLSGTATTWDDLQVGLISGKLGANAKPDFDYTKGAHLFPQNDTSEAITISCQMPHRWKLGSTVYPHVHWLQGANQNVTWVFDYYVVGVGSTTSASMSNRIILNRTTQTYTSGIIHQLSTHTAGISMGGVGLSAMLIGKLYRSDNAYTGDAPALTFDLHYEIDSLGSNTELTK